MSNKSFDEQEQKIPDEIFDLEEPSFNEDDSPDQIPPSDIIAYNELRSCADLFRMYARERLLINPDFQRDFVWKNAVQTRFIDSLIKSLPIPSMCLAFDNATDERIVIDGRQRMSTIVRFLEQKEKPWRLSRLDDIDPAISGKTSEQIKKDNPEYFDRVEEHTLPITVLRYNKGEQNHMDYIFTIFHRLNTGSEKLKNQEIRNCIYSGPLNNLLRNLDQISEWRHLNHMKPDDNHRFLKQELILRFFAFFYQEKEAYKGGMAKFLNDFMSKHRNDNDDLLQERRRIFKRVILLLFSKVFNGQEPKEHIPANALYPVMVGIAKNIDVLEKIRSPELSGRYRALIQSEAFADKANLANATIVQNRLQAAEDTFGSYS